MNLRGPLKSMADQIQSKGLAQVSLPLPPFSNPPTASVPSTDLARGGLATGKDVKLPRLINRAVKPRQTPPIAHRTPVSGPKSTGPAASNMGSPTVQCSVRVQVSTVAPLAARSTSREASGLDASTPPRMTIVGIVPRANAPIPIIVLANTPAIGGPTT